VLQKHWLNLYRGLCLAAVLVSALLYVHYTDPGDSSLCGGASGCEAVRQSGFAYFGSPYLNIPLLGIVAYAVLLLDSLGQLTAARVKRIRLMAGVGGVLALGFVVYQALVVGRFCWLCLIVDGCAIGAAFVAQAAAPGTTADAGAPGLRRWAWLALFALALALPLTWPVLQPPSVVPSQVRELFVAGKINVIEFADFQCPHCRRLHPTLKALVEEYGDRVHFRRLHMPLASHALAEGAAKAAVCGERLGQGEPMADRLFEGELGPEHYLGYAKELGLDRARFEECLEAPETSKAVDDDIERFHKADLRGLPTTFVGDQLVRGARPMAVFKDAFEQAAQQKQPISVAGELFVAAGVALALLLVWLGRVRRRAVGSDPSAAPNG
jgi:uncharacterized membrane protein/thiol-disulfide isomerase/thioredoxin